MNKVEKSLRWVVNQIPDFKPTTNEEKMLVAIKLYSEAGAEEIKRLESKNAELRARLDNTVELKYDVGDTVYLIQRTSDYPNGTILETTIWDVEMRKNKNGTFLNYYTELNNTYFSISEAEINVFAFTDKAAAEARLAEMKGEKNG